MVSYPIDTMAIPNETEYDSDEEIKPEFVQETLKTIISKYPYPSREDMNYWLKTFEESDDDDMKELFYNIRIDYGKFNHDICEKIYTEICSGAAVINPLGQLIVDIWDKPESPTTGLDVLQKIWYLLYHYVGRVVIPKWIKLKEWERLLQCGVREYAVMTAVMYEMELQSLFKHNLNEGFDGITDKNGNVWRN